jgi:uncharacterized MAPEG superfamily protein
MSIDLKLLAASALLTWVMLFSASMMRSRGWTPEGMRLAFGNRDQMPPPSKVAERADRAAKNMLENLLLFTAVIAAARAGGVHNDQVDLGAKLFFFARLLYWPVFAAGITYVRTLVWFVAVAGIFLIAAQVLLA